MNFAITIPDLFVVFLGLCLCGILWHGLFN